MAKYRKIDPRIWNDAKFRSMSDKGQLLFLFVLTHPHMTALGAMRASLDGLAAEKGWTSKAFREAFAEASGKGLLEVDETACFLAAPKFLKYNPPESPNVVKSWVHAVDLLPECNGKNHLIARVLRQTEGFGKGFREALPEAFCEDFAKAMPNQEQEQEQDSLLPSGDDGDTPEMVMEAWNASNSTKKARSLTKERRDKLRTRLRNTEWPWREALTRLPIPNDERFTWQPDFDWFVENDKNALGLVEGKYDRGSSQEPSVLTRQPKRRVRAQS